MKEGRIARSGPQYRLLDRTNWHHRVQICRTPLMRIEAQAPGQRLINKLDELVKQEPVLLGVSVPLPHPDVFPKEKDLMTPFWQPEDRKPMDRTKILGTKNPAHYYYVTTKLPDCRELKEADEIFNPCDRIDRPMEELHSRFLSPEPRGPMDQDRKLLQQRQADKIKRKPYTNTQAIYTCKGFHD